MTLGIGKKSGFTFLEILIVTLLLTVLVVISFPKLRHHYDSLLLKSEVELFKDFSDYSRDLSILMNVPIQLVINEDMKSYQIFKKNIDADADEDWIRISGRPGKKHKISSRIYFSSSTHEITYYPDGTSTRFESEWKNTYDKVFEAHIDISLAEINISTA